MLWDDQVREWKEEAREEGLAEGREEGREIGRAEGREEGRTAGIAEGENKKAIETARKMLKCNISVEIIAECTGLSMAEISALQEKQE